ncbi:MAG: exodeoxyribonuclease III [Candidatus Nanopelagicales bacterium]
MTRIISINVNGIRASARKGGLDKLAALKPDVVCMQEVRANREQLDEALAGSEFAGTKWSIYLADAEAKGRAGVAILSKLPVTSIKASVGSAQFAKSGRWIQGDIDTKVGPLTIASAYIPTGQVDTPKQIEKYAFLDAMTKRLRALHKAANNGGNQALVVGDYNIGRTELDIKNWRGNVKNSGFLPEERAYLTKWVDSGWADLGRDFAGEVEGPYTWWSMRGQAFDKDTGWRIDCMYSTPGLASKLKKFEVDRALSYDTRWSDHAPVIASF